VFCTGADDPLHESRRALIGRHVSGAALQRHAATMTDVWSVAMERLAALPPTDGNTDSTPEGTPGGTRGSTTGSTTGSGAGSSSGAGVERSNFNRDLLLAAQEVALRCWLGVEPTPGETEATLDRYFDTGSLLSEVLFCTWY